MNSGSADQALDYVINVDKGRGHQCYDGQTKLPDPAVSSSTTELESSILNLNASQISRVIAAPAMNPGAKDFYDFSAATKSVPQMRQVSGSLIKSKVSAERNPPALHKFPSKFHQGQLSAAASSRSSCRGGVVKAKNKRERRLQCVPTHVVKTDTSNFKAMVQHFTGMPHTTTTTDESILPPSAFSYSPRSTTSPISTSFSKPFPHPAVCKSSNSTASKSTTTMATTTCAWPATFVLPHLPISDPAALHKSPGQYNWL